jgi:sulfite exporter TauE/SafE
MCGGINLSQCIPHGEAVDEKKSRLSTFRPAFLYNLGRVISYTAIGFILGFAGLLLGGGSDAGLPTMFQGTLKLFAGAFMVVMGINMLGLFPQLRKLQPRMPKIFARKVGMEKAKNKSPLIVGLLNGLMPCGPLQSMQIVALASGNPFAGALSMFLFSLGTVPLMLGLGSIVSALGRKFTQKVMNERRHCHG